MLHRVTLLLVSLSLIGFLAGTVWVVPFLLVSACSAYAILFFCNKFRNDKPRLWSTICFSALCTAAFVTAQYQGLIGTLNGDTGSLINQSALTLGLPFYMLQVIGLYFDVLVKRIQLPSFLSFQNLIVYFPKFLSGPLEENKPFLEQLERFRFNYDAKRIDDGFSWVVLGVLFKFCLSGPLDRYVFRDELYDPLIIMISATMLEFRLYFDLAGYSFIVYGISRMMGVELTLNFNHPFLSKNVRDFWKNWHISLGRWFHNYLYVPLRQKTPNKAHAHLVLPLFVFLISAMWHGITFNFLLWSTFHGLVFVLFITFLHRFDWPRWAGLIGLWCFLIFGRLLFMESDADLMIQKLASVFSADRWVESIKNSPQLLHDLGLAAGFRLGMVFYPIVAMSFVFLEYKSKKYYPDNPYYLFRTGWGFLGCLILIMALISSDLQGFIYARQ